MDGIGNDLLINKNYKRARAFTFWAILIVDLYESEARGEPVTQKSLAEKYDMTQGGISSVFKNMNLFFGFDVVRWEQGKGKVGCSQLTERGRGLVGQCRELVSVIGAFVSSKEVQR